MSDATDAIIIGSGHNGLVAAIMLARAGWNVTVLEQASTPGGAVQSAELTVPGYLHDPYSGFYGLLHASPVFGELGLDHAIEWAHFDTPVGAATDPSHARVIRRSLDETVAGLALDGAAYRDLVAWWERIGSRFLAMSLQPIGALAPATRLVRRTKIRGSLELATLLLSPASQLARERFSDEAVRALLAAGITHTDVAADAPFGASYALILAMLAQTHGMPIPIGGAGQITTTLVRLLREAGGTLRCDTSVRRVVIERDRATGVELADGSLVRARRAVLANTGALALCRSLVGEEHLPARYLDGLRRFRYGTGMFKVDLALDRPLIWRASALDRCGVVHLTGSLDEMSRASHEASRGVLPAQPALIVGQHCVADPTRAPAGAATLWVETHAPPEPIGDGAGAISGTGWSAVRDAFLERIIDRIEAHAPGLRDRIVGTSVRAPDDLERENPNLVGGDVNGGSAAADLQAIFRPVPGWFRYRTPIKGLYLCSASAHPGGGVHGMAGRNCAQRVLRDRRIPRR